MGLENLGVWSFISNSLNTTVAVLDCRSLLLVSTAKTWKRKKPINLCRCTCYLYLFWMYLKWHRRLGHCFHALFPKAAGNHGSRPFHDRYYSSHSTIPSLKLSMGNSLWGSFLPSVIIMTTASNDISWYLVPSKRRLSFFSFARWWYAVNDTVVSLQAHFKKIDHLDTNDHVVLVKKIPNAPRSFLWEPLTVPLFWTVWWL